MRERFMYINESVGRIYHVFPKANLSFGLFVGKQLKPKASQVPILLSLMLYILGTVKWFGFTARHCILIPGRFILSLSDGEDSIERRTPPPKEKNRGLEYHYDDFSVDRNVYLDKLIASTTTYFKVLSRSPG
jgi:hypothetical protein